MAINVWWWRAAASAAQCGETDLTSADITGIRGVRKQRRHCAVWGLLRALPHRLYSSRMRPAAELFPPLLLYLEEAAGQKAAGILG